MDIFAHAFWTHAIHRSTAIQKKFNLTKKEIWLVIFFGIAPDLFSFGIFFVERIYRWLFRSSEFFLSGAPDPSSIPHYVYNAYNYTHSLVIFLLFFCIIWLLRKKAPWLIFGWGLHILIDIFSHSTDFFATPFLFPLSDVKINGVSWGHPVFMVINYSSIILIYLIFYLFKKSRYAKNTNYQK